MAIVEQAPDPPWLRGLNPGQRTAATHGDGPLLIVAGAGTGKTRTLVARVAALLARGVVPERVLLLTFSRRAAREMLDRAARLGLADARRVQGGTFHAAAHRALRERGARIGLAPGFSLLDAGDTADLLGIVRADLGFADPRGARFPRQDTLAAIYSRMVNAGESLAATLQDHFPWCTDHREAIGAVIRAFTERKRSQSLIDLDDLLLYWRALLHVEADADPTHDHVLVDEYQDVNGLQIDVLRSVCPSGRGLTVVGDDAQAIYGFRAATTGSMQRMADDLPDVAIVELDTNYRSTTPILDAANELMRGRSPIGTRLVSAAGAGPRPQLVICRDEAQQARAIVDLVLERREQGQSLREQAVLFRTGHHADRLELELTRRDVPFVRYGGLRFLERAHVKDLLALLRLLDNPHDELAWQRTLLALEGVGPVRARKAVDALGVTAPHAGGGVAPLARFVEGEPDLGRSEDVTTLRDALARASASGSPPVSAQITLLLPFLALTLTRRYGDASVRLADLERLVELASGCATRASFLAEVTLDPPASTSDLAGPPHLDDDWLTLSTIHSAKGGEWTSVYVIQAADGCIPSDMALGSREGLEEERRLLYVAITRARRHLTVSAPVRFYHHRDRLDDAHVYGQVSRFLRPIQHAFDLRPHLDAPDLTATTTRDPVDAYVSDLLA